VGVGKKWAKMAGRAFRFPSDKNNASFAPQSKADVGLPGGYSKPYELSWPPSSGFRNKSQRNGGSGRSSRLLASRNRCAINPANGPVPRSRWWKGG